MFFIAGLLLWVILEYFVHRFILHKYGRLHRLHHLSPKDKSNLFIEPTTSVGVSIIVWAVLLIFLPALSVFWMYLGILTGYGIYEYVHYNVHHRACKNKIMRYLKKNHTRHHYLDDSKNFSVTFPILDKIFGTS